MENKKEYPFNLIKIVFGEDIKTSKDKNALIEILDKSFKTLKSLPIETQKNFESVELPLSKSVDVAEAFFKNNKTIEELAIKLNVNKEVVNSAINKVVRKLRHPKLARTLM